MILAGRLGFTASGALYLQEFKYMFMFSWNACIPNPRFLTY